MGKKVYFDNRRLFCAILAKYGSTEHFAEVMGIGTDRLNRILGNCGSSSFRTDEIEKAASLLGIGLAELNTYFFTALNPTAAPAEL